jgi:hypothetical protein
MMSMPKEISCELSRCFFLLKKKMLAKKCRTDFQANSLVQKIQSSADAGDLEERGIGLATQITHTWLRLGGTDLGTQRLGAERRISAQYP